MHLFIHKYMWRYTKGMLSQESLKNLTFLCIYDFIGDHDNCVKHLTNAMAVCGQPEQLLQVFQNMLPPTVFQMLLQNLAKLGSSQQVSKNIIFE